MSGKGIAGMPKNHPRFASLRERHLLECGVKAGITTPTGLVAFGRGEAFDYLLGEKTSRFAKGAARAAAAKLLLSSRPVISVNGNAAVLCPREIIALRKALPNSAIEVNLFYRSHSRLQKIKKLFAGFGEKILGADRKSQTKIASLGSARAVVDKNGIAAADTVLVMLEDGDRTEALRNLGKFVIAVDLNPLSRTSRKACITIVDNVTRAVPLLGAEIRKLKKENKTNAGLQKISGAFSNRKNLEGSLELIRGRVK